MGKYYSAVAEPDAHADTEPDTIGFARQQSACDRGIADFDICLSDCEPNAFAIAVKPLMSSP